MGSIQTFGVYVPILLVEFGVGSGELGWVASSANAIVSLAGPFGSVVVKRFGCRRAIMIGGTIMALGIGCASFATNTMHLFVLLGLTVGLGGTMVHVGLVVAIGKYYNRHHSVANGLAFSGIGAGIFAFPSVLQFFTDTFGWRGSCIIEAAIVSHVVVMGALLRPASRYKTRNSQHANFITVTEIKGHNDKENDSREIDIEDLETDEPGNIRDVKESNIRSDSGKLRGAKISRCFNSGVFKLVKDSPSLLLVNLSCFLLDAGYSAFIYHITNQAVLSGMTTNQASGLLSSVGIGSLVGRLAHGFVLLKRKYITPYWMLILLLLVSALCATLTAVPTTFGGTITCVTIFGVASGAVFPLLAVINREFAGISQLSLAYGLTLFCSGAGSLLGGYLIGVIKDATGNYTVPFYLIGILFTVAAVVLVPRPMTVFYRRRKAFGAWDRLRTLTHEGAI